MSCFSEASSTCRVVTRGDKTRACPGNQPVPAWPASGVCDASLGSGETLIPERGGRGASL